MTQNQRIGAGFAALVLLTGIYYWADGRRTPPAAPPQDPQEEEAPLNVYQHAGFGFEVRHGEPFLLYEGARLDLIRQLNVIPPCDPEFSAACLHYPAEAAGNTNFRGAGFSVNIYPARFEAECMTIPPRGGGPVAVPVTRALNGINFLYGETAGAAAGSQHQDRVWRTYRNGRCYELTERILTATFENYPEGSIERFTDAQREAVWAELEKVLQTFRFLQSS